jgi:hypothetical protein
MRAQWFVHRDKDSVSLQIELGADYAVLLCCTRDGPNVSLWRGSGSHDFSHHGSLEALASWCDEAALAYRPAPVGGLPMKDIAQLRAAVDTAMAALETLGAVMRTARVVGDDETDLGNQIQTLDDETQIAHGRLLERISAIERAFAPDDHAEWLDERIRSIRSGQPVKDPIPFLTWLAKKRGQ